MLPRCRTVLEPSTTGPCTDTCTEANSVDVPYCVDLIRRDAACTVLAPQGVPSVRAGNLLPDDLKSFYESCGGVVLFRDKDYGISVVPPPKLRLANPVVVGELCEEDISSSWYVVAESGDQLISIDLDPGRLGRCYDSFYECHGVAGSCPIIAFSFAELLERLYGARGEYWFWLRSDFVSLGDAYDNIGN